MGLRKPLLEVMIFHAAHGLEVMIPRHLALPKFSHHQRSSRLHPRSWYIMDTNCGLKHMQSIFQSDFNKLIISQIFFKRRQETKLQTDLNKRWPLSRLEMPAVLHQARLFQKAGHRPSNRTLKPCTQRSWRSS